MDKLHFNFTKAYDLVVDKVDTWIDTSIKMLPNLVVAIVVLLVFVVIGKVAKRGFLHIAKRLTDNHSLQKLLGSLIYITIVAIGTFTALSILKLDGAVTSLLAGAGVIGLALGFAFQEIASNFIAGTMMSIRKPFKTGDLIMTNDYYGIVKLIHLRTTELQTMQGQIVQIPNSHVFKNPIVNYTQFGKRRVDITVGVTYGEDLPKAKQVAHDAISALEGIDKKGITIFYTGFNNSSIDFTIRYWIKFTNKHFEYLDAQDRGVIAIKQAFDKNDITIPFPIRTLDMGSVDFPSIFKTYATQTSPTSGKQNG